MNRLTQSRQVQVVTALVEGMSINATCRMTGVAKHTVLKLLKDIGCAAAAFHNTPNTPLQLRPPILIAGVERKVMEAEVSEDCAAA